MLTFRWMSRLLVGAAFGLAAVSAAEPHAEFAISFGSQHSSPAEIEIVGRLTNLSARALTLKNRFYLGSDIGVAVVDAKGSPLPLLPPAPPPPLRRDDFVELAPGESIERSIGQLDRMLSRPLDPGTYRISARYTGSSGAELGLDAYHGELVSNELTLFLRQEINSEE